MLKKQLWRLFVINSFLLLTIGVHAEKTFAQHPCDNYPVTVCNIPSSFSAWSVQDNNSIATGQINEPTGDPNAVPLNTLWYSWTAPTSGTIVTNTRFTNANNTFVFDTVIAVYRATGSGTITTLQQIAANDDWSNASPCSINLDAPRPPDEIQNSSCVLFTATAGETYFFQVDGYANFLGPFYLNLYYLAPLAANVSVSGRITDNNGSGIPRVRVRLTKPNGEILAAMTNVFGYYKFENLEAGQIYILQANSKRFQFQNNPRVLTVSENVENEDFTAIGEALFQRE